MRSAGVLLMWASIWFTIGSTLHADGAELLRVVGLFEGSPCFAVAFVVAVVAAELLPRLWAVDEHQVEVVEPRGRQRLVDGRYGFVEGLHVGGELRRHEHLLSRHTAGPEPFADAGFVAVRLCSVDVAVPDRRRVPHHLCGVVVVDEPSSETEFRNVDAVTKGVRLVQNHLVTSCPSRAVDAAPFN